MTLLHILEEAESHIPQLEEQNAKVSRVAVAWHLDHLIQVCLRVLQALQESKPLSSKKKFNFIWFFISATNYIPRGKGKSPKSVDNTNTIQESDLISAFQEVKSTLQIWNSISSEAHFQHPYFGPLDKKNSLHFLKIHSQHHLKIIRDVLHSNAVIGKH